MEYDFDTWSRLSRDDPQAFERARLEAIEAVIAQAPPEQRQRLRALQFRIDLERQRTGNALGACIRISRMMWSRFHELQRSLEELQAQVSHHREITPRPAPVSAQVLPFPARR